MVDIIIMTEENSSKRNPGDFLKQCLGRPVVVKLNTGEDYRGILACLDGFMNIAMGKIFIHTNTAYYS